ncbi:hypothetical protein RHGRI_013737 [Rhododendron griersonianum]|uniref:Uncharacterized protein n=1 Tax=Rhododendron griersonianum TaxID=479676 RepID=A0AAV6K6M7_9ERIC|nr:hypothetical protein RHGRI_013737 [Rhododendron griersonianum]
MLFDEQEKRKSEEWSRIDSEEKDSLDANPRKKTVAMFQSFFFFFPNSNLDIRSDLRSPFRAGMEVKNIYPFGVRGGFGGEWRVRIRILQYPPPIRPVAIPTSVVRDRAQLLVDFSINLS